MIIFKSRVLLLNLSSFFDDYSMSNVSYLISLYSTSNFQNVTIRPQFERENFVDVETGAEFKIINNGVNFEIMSDELKHFSQVRIFGILDKLKSLKISVFTEEWYAFFSIYIFVIFVLCVICSCFLIDKTTLIISTIVLMLISYEPNILIVTLYNYEKQLSIVDLFYNKTEIVQKMETFSNIPIVCETCKTDVSEYKYISDSSKNDTIFSFFYSYKPSDEVINKYINSLNKFVRSLRTTGSRCKVVIFSNILNVTKEMESCGVIIINATINYHKKQDSIVRFLRFYLVKQFINDFGEYIDRCMFCDLRDTLFQYDPFNTLFERSKYIYISTENNFIGSCKVNSKWFYQVKNVDYEHYFKNKIINSGLIAGDKNIVESVFHLITVMLGGDNFVHTIHDQVYWNMLIHSATFFHRYSKKAVFCNDESFLSTVSQSLNKTTLLYNRSKIAINNTIPAVVHQYDRIRNFTLQC